MRLRTEGGVFEGRQSIFRQGSNPKLATGKYGTS